MISDLLEGEWIQDSLVGDFSVTVEQLDRVHNLKTASLFKWCLRSSFIALERYETELHQTLEEMGTILGQLFQRSDDLLDFDVRNYEGKAILGDLKSGYLNSFASFVVQGISSEAKNKLILSQSLGEFKQNLGLAFNANGDQIFEQKLKSFDDINTGLIELYNHHLENLKKFLKPDELKLLQDLMPLTTILYWRKKPS